MFLYPLHRTFMQRSISSQILVDFELKHKLSPRCPPIRKHDPVHLHLGLHAHVLTACVWCLGAQKVLRIWQMQITPLNSSSYDRCTQWMHILYAYIIACSCSFLLRLCIFYTWAIYGQPAESRPLKATTAHCFACYFWFLETWLSSPQAAL